MIKHKPTLITLFSLLLLTAFTARAQNDKTGVFGIATIVLPGDSTHRWGGYVEAQTRSEEVFNKFKNGIRA